VYRYAVRNSKNIQINLGAISAFSIVRAINMVIVPSSCTSLPLNCGPPFYYFDYTMITFGLTNLFESLVSFGIAALSIELATRKGFINTYI
jgi:hypothetical protein